MRSTRSGGWFPYLVTAACALHLLLVALAGPGFMSSDDEVYARLANDLTQGTFELIPEHRANRLGLIAPTALAYAVLGVGRWTTVLWPLVWSLAGIVLVAAIARRVAGDRAGALAALLLAPLTVHVNGSAFLIPDGPVGVQMLASVASLWMARESTGRAAVRWAVASALMVSVGVLVKLTTLWMAPFFLVLFVADVIRRRHLAAWGAFAATGAACAAVFFGTYALATGDALYRLHAVQEQHNETHWAYEDAAVGDLVARMTYEPALLIAGRLPELALALALAAAAVLLPAEGERRRHVMFWAGYGLVVLAGFWVGTTSFSRWAPLPLLPRMLGPAVTPAVVLAAVALAGERSWSARLVAPVLVLAAASTVVAVEGRLLVAALYATALVASAAALGGRGRVRRAGVACVLTLPLAMCAYSIARGGAGESADMRAERMLAVTLARHVGPDAVVLTDRRSERTFAFYRGYLRATPAVIAWDGLESLPTAEGGVLAYHDPGRAAWRGGRMAPPDWLEERLRDAPVVHSGRRARLVRLAP